jgi:hypothetical protein
MTSNQKASSTARKTISNVLQAMQVKRGEYSNYMKNSMNSIAPRSPIKNGQRT